MIINSPVIRRPKFDNELDVMEKVYNEWISKYEIQLYKFTPPVGNEKGAAYIRINNMLYSKLLQYLKEDGWSLNNSLPSRDIKDTTVMRNGIYLNVMQRINSGNDSGPIIILMEEMDDIRDFDQFQKHIDSKVNDSVLENHMNIASDISIRGILKYVVSKLDEKEANKLVAEIDTILNEVEENIDTQTERINREMQIMIDQLKVSMLKFNKIETILKTLPNNEEGMVYLAKIREHLLNYSKKPIISISKQLKTLPTIK